MRPLFLDVPQALPICQFSEGHTEKLIETRERLDLVFPVVPGNTTTKRRQWKMLRQLRENQGSLVHDATPRSQSSERDRTHDCSSNRDQTKSSFNHYYSISYWALPAKRWDTTENIEKINVSPFSFSLQLRRIWRQHSNGQNDREGLRVLLRLTIENTVGHRPGRVEPRKVKRW